MTPLQQFAALLAELNELSSARVRDTIRAEYADALRADWQAAKVKRKFDEKAAEKRLGELLESFQQPFRDKARAADEAIGKRRDAIGDELYRLAPLIKLTPQPDTWTVYSTVYESSYLSQPASGKYAACMAELQRREAELHVAGARVETHPGESPREYRVIVPLDALHTDVLRKRDGMSVRDFLKASWGMGCNPRVFNPLLPYDLEGRYGLDYFGNEISRPGGN